MNANNPFTVSHYSLNYPTIVLCLQQILTFLDFLCNLLKPEVSVTALHVQTKSKRNTCEISWWGSATHTEE